MKFTPSLAGAMSGSLGGITASRNRSGQYFRRRAVPVNPNTTAQAIMRSILAGLAQDWVNILTPTQRQSWETYAQNLTWTNTLGESADLTGINEFIRSNSPRRMTQVYALQGFTLSPSLPDVTDAPVIFDRGTNVEINAVEITFAAGPPIENQLLVQGGSIGAQPSDVLVYVSPPVNPTNRYWKGPWFYVGNQADSVLANLFGGDLADVTATPWAARYPSLAVGQAIHVMARRTYDDGRLSTPTMFGPVEVVVAP